MIVKQIAEVLLARGLGGLLLARLGVEVPDDGTDYASEFEAPEEISIRRNWGGRYGIRGQR